MRQRRPISIAVALAVALLTLTACPDPPNYLDGSIGEVFDLSFDQVRIRHYSATSEFQIEYLKTATDGGLTQAIVKITLKTPEGGFPLNTEIKFAQVDGTIKSPAHPEIPDLEDGNIDFSAGANKVGDQTTGKFAAIFTNRRTLRGNFDAKMEEATAN